MANKPGTWQASTKPWSKAALEAIRAVRLDDSYTMGPTFHELVEPTWEQVRPISQYRSPYSDMLFDGARMGEGTVAIGVAGDPRLAICVAAMLLFDGVEVVEPWYSRLLAKQLLVPFIPIKPDDTGVVACHRPVPFGHPGILSVRFYTPISAVGHIDGFPAAAFIATQDMDKSELASRYFQAVEDWLCSTPAKD